MADYSRAFVRPGPNGLVMEDPDADQAFRAICKAKCRDTFDNQYDRVKYFKTRADERGLTPDSIVIVLINADDSCGSVLADSVMPCADWDSIRARGEVPFARGLCDREGIQEFVDTVDPDCGEKLRSIKGLATVVVDFDTVEVFEVAC